MIVGGGFAGVELARSLGRQLPKGWELVLYSRENHFVFTPLLSEVVGAALSPLHAVWAIREMVRRAECRTATVIALDLERRELVFRGPRGEPERQGFDHLVLACGLPVRLDLTPGMSHHGWPLKTLGDAYALRNHLIGQLERAQIEPDPDRKARLLGVVVVGGGFTGVEVAGSINDLLRKACRYYERIEPEEIRVVLLNHGSRILSALSESLSAFAERKLSEAGVEVRNAATVEEIASRGARLEGGEAIASGTVVSAVGNGVHPLIANSGLPLERNRLRVGADLRVEGQERVWALGDCAAVPNALDGSVCPTLAQFALRQARHLARSLVDEIRGGDASPFGYRPQGMFAAIGHRNAVGQAYGIRLSGFPAWVLWHGIYWAKMPTAARKLQVAFDWLWDLFFPPDIVELSMERTDRSQPEGGRATAEEH